eukprot:19187_1
MGEIDIAQNNVSTSPPSVIEKIFMEILTPGANSTSFSVLNVVLSLLCVTLGVMAITGQASFHASAMLLLALMLIGVLNWFVSEIRKVEALDINDALQAKTSTDISEPKVEKSKIGQKSENAERKTLAETEILKKAVRSDTKDSEYDKNEEVLSQSSESEARKVKKTN